MKKLVLSSALVGPMAFLKRSRRSKNGGIYQSWAIVESVRTAKGPRRRTIATLGKTPEYDAEERVGGKTSSISFRAERGNRGICSDKRRKLPRRRGWICEESVWSGSVGSGTCFSHSLYGSGCVWTSSLRPPWPKDGNRFPGR